MTNTQIVKALLVLRPGAQWCAHGDMLNGIEWLDSDQSRPTDQEIQDKISELYPS